MTGPRLILASSSPRRQLLLSAAGYQFDVVHPNVGEEREPGESPDAMVLRLATDKAAAARVDAGPQSVVLGADTVVTVDGDVLGKPGSTEEAVAMLLRLEGRAHQVLTGWAIDAPHGERFGVVESIVRFNPRSEAELRDFVERTDPLDKAGAYAIQADDGWLIASVSGSRSNVMGLPMREVAEALAEVGVARSAPDGV